MRFRATRRELRVCLGGWGLKTCRKVGGKVGRVGTKCERYFTVSMCLLTLL